MSNTNQSSTEFPKDEPGSGERVTDRVQDARDSISDMAEMAADTVASGRETAADGLGGAASTLHDQADGLPGGPRVREFAHAAADRLGTAGDYVRDHDATSMMADVEGLVKNNPGVALAVAATFGFLLGRALSRD